MSEPKRPLKVFLCHAHADRASVRALYSRLKREGVDAWLDKEKLLPGSDWELEIRKAVRDADVVVVCLSKQFNQAGFRQKEVRIALDTAMEQPEGEIFIIPARLEECENLESLSKWHWVDLFEDDGYQSLIRALRARADRIGATLRIRGGRQSITSPLRSKESEKKTEPPASEIDINDAVSGNVIATETWETQSFEKAEQEATEKIAREKAEREAAEKVAREKADREVVEKAAREKLERDVTESAKHEKVKAKTVEEKPLRKSYREESRNTETRGSDSRFGTSPIFRTIGIIAIIAVLIVILLQVYPPPYVPTATASATMTFSPAQTATLHSDPTPTITRTPTIVSTNTPDYLGGSEILFATKGGSIYSFANNTNSKIGSITVPDEWSSQSKVLGTYSWSWDVSKDSFIVQGLHTNQDVYFVDRSGQVISSLEVPYTSYCPNLSRDGKKIVVYSQAVTNGNIWVFNTDGSGFIRLSLSSTMRFGCPAWSPDGKMITAGASDSEGSYVVIMDLTGAVIKQFAMTNFLWSDSPKWSPDGKSLIVCEESGIYRLDIDNSDIVKLLSSSVNACDWSPDGRSVVSVTTDGLNLLDVNTGAVISLLDMKDVVSVAWK